jgi:hypothetical protein
VLDVAQCNSKQVLGDACWAIGLRSAISLSPNPCAESASAESSTFLELEICKDLVVVRLAQSAIYNLQLR